MNDVMCQEARIIAGVEAAGVVTNGRQSSVSANDLLVNLSWALILILAIAAIVAAGQAQAINDINNVIGSWDDKGKSEAIIEVFRQKLIRKIDAVYDTGKIPSSFPECLQLAGLNVVDHVLLEEAEAAVVKIVREQVEYATPALRSKLLILKALEQSQESKLTVDVAAGVPKSSIVSEWTTLAEKEWSQSGGPASRFKLFPRTHKEIEKAVSKHFDAIQERIRQRLADRQASGVSNKSASSGDQFQRVAKLPTPMETRDTQRSTAAAATSTSDRSGGGAGGGGSPGAGGGAGGNGGGAGGGGSGQDAGDRDGQERERNPGVDGEGPAPDCAILLEDLRAGACGARVMFPSAELSPSGPSPTCDFDPGDIDKSSSQIVQVFWPSIASPGGCGSSIRRNYAACA